MVAGWIKLHRKILDNPVFLKPELYQLFSYCLLRANHNETKIIWNSQEETMEKGCFITGRKSIASDLNQNERTIYDRLKLLEKLKMISVKSNNKFSVVKVLNYCIYQGEETDSQQQTNNKPTTNQQQTNTDKNIRTKELKKSILPKKQFSETVLLLESEYQTLIDKYGEQNTTAMIEKLNFYKMANGKKYASDYGAINSWVAKEILKEKPKQSDRKIKY
jgi:hypothetical protein